MGANEPPITTKVDNGNEGPAGPDRRTLAEVPVPAVHEPGSVVVPPSDDKTKAGKKGPYKLSKREKKLVKDAHRNLDSWERYRALTDVLGEALDLVDLADHKARFALIIMGSLNALLFLLGTRTDAFDAIPSSWRGGMSVFVLLYAVLAVYFVVQAIESLRPRKAQPQVRYAAETGLEDFPVGIRFYEDILSRDVEAYRRAWREVRIGQLNAELAVQAHALAQINKAKYNALRKLYLGLLIMTITAAALLAIGTYFVLAGKAHKLDLLKKNKTQLIGELQESVRFGKLGVKEPSGVAFNPDSGHLFVVGDEGKLAEVDQEGQSLRVTSLSGVPDLEDVAFHPPTHQLILLAERDRQLIVFDPAANQERSRFPLDEQALLDEPPLSPNEGFEGLAFQPEKGRPGGGIFYLAHQRTPAKVVAIAFDPTQGGRKLGAESVVGRWPVANHKDLTAITYVPSLDRLLVVADSSDRLIVAKTDGTVERELALPGKVQEGIASDDSGRLWVADDKDKSLLRFDQGLATLEKAESQGRSIL
jgi:uncharacterized protein YjiK